MKKQPRELVIDTDIAQAVGTTQHPTTSACRNLFELLVNRKTCHKIVMSAEIKREWKEHQSAYAEEWLQNMCSQKKVKRMESLKNAELRGKIDTFAHSDNDAYEMQKDIHLIEAAIATHHIVISMDEKARKHFHNASSQIEELQPIIWVNPAPKKPEQENAVDWLKKGAKPEKKHQLGFQE